MTTRSLFALVSLSFIALLASTTRAQPAAQAPRPNILFCLADDWGFHDAGAYGSKAARTPAFDRLAREGALFTRAFSAAPSCTASRGSILTGQAPHRLGEGGNLWSKLPPEYVSYPDLLEKAGYRIGKMRKAWGPGSLGTRPRDPAGPNFKSFEEFLNAAPAAGPHATGPNVNGPIATGPNATGPNAAASPAAQPFCFWFGSPDPHRPYVRAFGEASGIDPKSVVVPPYIQDTPEVRADIVDYLAEVQRFDKEVGQALDLLEKRGLAGNTIVVMTGDNGWPWPHGKANLYDPGTRQPLVVRWPGKVAAGSTIDRLTVLTDFAPTFLQAAGLPIPADMTGQSVVPTLLATQAATEKGTGAISIPPRPAIFLERERHARVRAGNVGYPCRAIRTEKYLYIRNFFPERWPAGDPDLSGVQGAFGDIDSGPTKTQLLAHQADPAYADFFKWSCAKRPAEELFDVLADPHSLKNLADDPKLAEVKKDLAAQLAQWMETTNDPRAKDPQTTVWDTFDYFGEKAK